MKILFLHDATLDSGKANIIQVLNMCRALTQCGNDVELAVPVSQKVPIEKLLECAEEQIEKKIEFKIVPYRKWTIAGRLAVIGGGVGIHCLLKNVQADCCLTRNPLYADLALRKGMPTVFEAHNSIFHDNRLLNKVFSKNLLINARRKNMVGFITISKNLENFWVMAGVSREKTLALHDCVDVDNYRDIPTQQFLRMKLQLPIDRKIVAYTGSLYPDREIKNILALAQLNPDAFFVLVGGPNKYSSNFAEMALRQGVSNISFTGHVPHARVKDYLFAADVLLMVWSKRVRTINYCSPLKVFEYMATGRVIVGHGFPTIREVLTDGTNALLADPEIFDQLNQKLRQGLALPVTNRLGQAARSLAFRAYTWESRARKILKHISRGLE